MKTTIGKTKKCKYCQADIPAKATVCPNCKRNLRSMGKSILLLAVFTIVFGIYVVNTAKDNALQTTPTASTNEGNEETKNKKDEYTKLNKSGELVTGVTLTVNKVRKIKRINLYNGTMYSEPDDEGASFLAVNVTIKNKSDDAQELNMLYFNLIGPDGEEYVPSIIVGADEEYITLDAINPNLKKTGNIAFEVPSNINLKKCKLCYNKKGTFDNNHYFKLK